MDVLSWMTTLSVWLAFSSTVLLLTSRVSLLWLLRLYKYEQIHPVTWYLIIAFVLGTPHLTETVLAFWGTPIISGARGCRLPRLSRVMMGMMASTLEGVATAVFATEVAHALPEPVLTTLPYATLTFLIIKDVYTKVAQTTPEGGALDSVRHNARSWCQAVTAGYMMCVTPAVGVVLSAWSTFGLSVQGCVVLTMSITILAAVWHPDVQRKIRLSESGTVHCPLADLLYAPIKLTTVLVTVYLSIFFKLDDFRVSPQSCLTLALEEIAKVKVWLPVVLCCLSGLLCFLNVLAAFKVGLTTAGVKLPMFVCPVFASLATTVLWDDLETDAFWEVTGIGVYAWTAIGLSAITWLIPFFLPIFSGFQNFKNKRYTIGACVSWSSFFLEPRLIMSNYFNTDNDTPDELSGKFQDFPRKKTVYICTTMYKESEPEMKRYVASIKNVFEKNDPKKVNLEAHVFFDSSVVDGKVTPLGRQLLALLCRTFGLKLNDLEKKATPYGCQVNTRSLINYPAYIHFKDTSKVKGKKRWSQVMYMHYVLNFRHIESQTSGFCNMEYDDKSCRFQTGCAEPREPAWSCSHGSREPAYSLPNYCTLQDSTASSTCSNCYVRGQVSLPFCKSDSRLCEESKESSVLDSAGFWTSYDHVTGGGYGRECQSRELQAKVCSVSLGSVNDDSAISCISSSTSSSPWCNMKTHILPNTHETATSLDNVYLLTTDADTEFSADSLANVLEQCETDPDIGAVCGRTVPIGSAKPIVWYQKFEYAKDFWLVKSSQNVIGSVTCCPGCFSIYRGAAMANVFQQFCTPPHSAFDNLVMDHGEDRWLCTLLMQAGWRLAYSSQAHNSTHCPETVGEFLRQRRRWVLSELSNMAAIFVTLRKLVRNNASFSGMFLISLLTTFLWVVLSPATTLVFMCAGLEVLFSVTMAITLPVALAGFFCYCIVCCVANQHKQKLVSIATTSVVAAIVVSLGVGFVFYVINAVQTDLEVEGKVHFRPYFLVFILIIAIVYAAVLHPSELTSLVYGVAYALLFPSMFIILPVYALANMLDQSWGTREAGSHGCCQQPQVEEDEDLFLDYSLDVDSLPNMEDTDSKENKFWKNLQHNVIGNYVNNGKSGPQLADDLSRLRRQAMSGLVASNLVWFVSLSLIYLLAGSDVICYLVAAVFSFSLLVQLVGLTCYKFNSVIEAQLKENVSDYIKT
ncbi:uncharacterized protein LOC131951039 [Physella acuta]|uniref:uncharacterized protein LOC131951039 n=1 Tax=Physella acuta TaxID=109671 RepID=UPI0027DD12AE|nr:uncharacterized protein LOC131951039 [Physella acuta]